MKLWKQALWGVGVGLVMSGFMFFMTFKASQPKLDKQGKVIQPPPPQYPYVDQISMTLTLRTDERFVSYQRVGSNGEYFRLITEVIEVTANPTGKRTLRVYSGLMEGSGTMINQPYLAYTIKEQ